MLWQHLRNGLLPLQERLDPRIHAAREEGRKGGGEEGRKKGREDERKGGREEGRKEGREQIIMGQLPTDVTTLNEHQ